MLSCHLALSRYLYTVFLPAVGGAGEGSGPPGLSDPSLSTSLFEASSCSFPQPRTLLEFLSLDLLLASRGSSRLPHIGSQAGRQPEKSRDPQLVFWVEGSDN